MDRRRFIRSASVAALAAALPLPSPAATAVIAPGADGMISVDGKRDFILGLYQLPKAADPLREARDAGFNVVLRPADRAAYDEAHAHGLRAWSSLGSIPASNSADAEARIRRAVESLRDHPALLFWETEDEPTYEYEHPEKIRTPPERLVAAADLVRSLDPGRPLYLNHAPTNLVSTLRRYNAASDIVATDIYPVIPHGIRPMYALWPDGRQGDFSDATIAQVGRYADKMREVAGPSRAVFMVLQAFAWETLRQKDRDAKLILYPSEAQLRFMAWQAVAHGVNGLIWWGLGYEEPTAPLWANLKTVVRELADLREALAAPRAPLDLKIEYRDTGHSLDRGIEWIAKAIDGEILLIGVNADGNPVDATFEGLGAFNKCEPAIGDAKAKLADGKLRERFEPFGVRVWRLSR